MVHASSDIETVDYTQTLDGVKTYSYKTIEGRREKVLLKRERCLLFWSNIGVNLERNILAVIKFQCIAELKFYDESDYVNATLTVKSINLARFFSSFVPMLYLLYNICLQIL